jgi:hypothetical protein
VKSDCLTPNASSVLTWLYFSQLVDLQAFSTGMDAQGKHGKKEGWK